MNLEKPKRLTIWNCEINLRIKHVVNVDEDKQVTQIQFLE